MNQIVKLLVLLPVYIFAINNNWDIELLDKIKYSPVISESKKSQVLISFPTPEGKMIEFEMFLTPVMPKGLSSRFPQIKTYSGRGVENPNDRASVTLNGENAKILLQTRLGNVFIDKMTDGHYRISYDEYGVNAELVQNHISSCTCGREILAPEIQNTDSRDFPYCVGGDEPCFEIGNNLVTFRYAAILTAEANNEVADGTVSGGLAWIAAMANQVNLVWIRELSFRLELVENSDLIIYTAENPTPEAFTDYDMYVELERVMSHLESVIGPGGYITPQADLVWEYGAVFNSWYGGGLAYVPGSTSANLPSYAVHIHEIGHNLGSSHNCTYEGGWASTLGGTAMCNRTSTLPGSYGDQYSSHTIDIAIRYQNEPYWLPHYYYQLGYSQEVTDNEIPELFVPESGFYIPKETPFKFEGYAIDSDSDNLTYAWEQNDASDYGWSPPDYPAESGPLFCSIDAKTDGNVRYFPYMESLLANYYSTGSLEQLPFASREINMRLQVRDNDLYSGAYNYKNVRFNVDETAGPFRVTSQNTEVNWETNSLQIVEWDVANTDNPSTVNCNEVDILLSVDWGENFDIVLAENVANDGSHEVFVPLLPTLNGARIMVKSSDNIFFDINNSFFQIVNDHQPQAVMDTDIIEVQSPVDMETTIIRNIENGGDAGSFLIYGTQSEIDYEGEGYLSFDGYDDYVDFGANLLSGDGDFSISLWFKSNSTNGVLIQQRNGGFNGEYQLIINGNGQLDIFTYRDGYKWSVVSPNSYNDDYWHHVVVVQSNEINGGLMYVDGELVGSNSNGVVYLADWIHSYLGADMRDYNGYLNGKIDEVLIFKSSLNQYEVQEIFESGFDFNPIYNQGDFISASHLSSYYPFTAMSGNVLQDIQGNNPGNIVGPEWSGDFISLPNWLNVESDNNWLNAGQSDEIQININPEGLNENSNYTGNLIVTTNYESLPIIVPVHLETTGSSILGDINLDGIINIIDVVQVVNLVLSTNYNSLADMNSDGIINILDIVQIVSIILEN